MKVIATALFVMFSVVLSGYGSVSFKWNSTADGQAQYWDTATSAYSNAPQGYTVLTYISSDTVVNFDYGTTLQSSYGSGSDTYLQANPTTLTGGRYTTTTIDTGNPGDVAPVGYYAYLVLVAMKYTDFTGLYGGNIAQIPVGTLYGVSVRSAKLRQNDLSNNDPPEPDLTAQLLAVGTVRADIALVPEPSTFALLGIGLGLVGLRRFRRK